MTDGSFSESPVKTVKCFSMGAPQEAAKYLTIVKSKAPVLGGAANLGWRGGHGCQSGACKFGGA